MHTSGQCEKNRPFLPNKKFDQFTIEASRILVELVIVSMKTKSIIQSPLLGQIYHWRPNIHGWFIGLFCVHSITYSTTMQIETKTTLRLIDRIYCTKWNNSVAKLPDALAINWKFLDKIDIILLCILCLGLIFWLRNEYFFWS